MTDRLWNRVDRSAGDDECWPWTGSTNGFGYGRLSLGGRYVYAHRVAYECEVGEIPEGLVLDHLCRNRLCCNPAHLEAVTHRVNILRGTSPAAARAAADFCHRGHPFDETNTYVRPSGQRTCITCQRMSVERNRDVINARKRARRAERKAS